MKLSLLLSIATALSSLAQQYGQPDRSEPGDEMIQGYLQAETAKLEGPFLNGITTAEEWLRTRPERMREYYEMLGLWPLPERTPLNATITRTIDRGDYFVDMLHYQSRPGLYVTANLYRPARTERGSRHPAVFYVCGHSARGRNGNKTAFQSHGIWLARHGYVCLMVDTLQLGEIAGIHHGTYREGRWWWLSRGYTPAGVECWNGIRGIDYLVSREDVDPERIGVTGISGGGASTFWIAAADDRVKVAIPVSGMADLESYIPSRMINGHCDCMFLYNTHQWHWTTIAGLIAPRPMLFVNSDNDPIFPMDANERVINRLERLYSLFGKSDLVDAFVSIGGHDYRQDIRQAAFRFLNTHLKNDPRPINDSEIDLVTGSAPSAHPIPPEQLRVFPEDKDIPQDARNGQIDQEFVPINDPGTPGADQFARWRNGLLERLRDLVFAHFPERVPPGTLDRGEDGTAWLKTEPGIRVRLAPPQNRAEEVLLKVSGEAIAGADATAFVLEPRGIGRTRWTQKNPPNYVERSHYLLGRTVDSGRVWDIIAAARHLHQESGKPVVVRASGAPAVLAMYAALLEPEIARVEAQAVPGSLMDPAAPALLNALRVCDIPHVARMLGNRVKISSSPALEQSLPKQ